MSPGWVPNRWKQIFLTKLLQLLQGSYARYGLPVNTELALSHHPTLNSDLLDFIRHGRILPRPGIATFEGDEVQFTDGKREAFDIVCACTGFWTTFPFFDKALIDYQHVAKIPLYRKMMHPDYRDLYFIGLFQPSGCIWPLADHQARLACLEILGKYQRPEDLHAEIEYEIAHPHFEFAGGLRHAMEVDYHSLRNELRVELRKAGVDIGKARANKSADQRLLTA
jgi:Flavin-binding monooxygenase-like